MAQKPDERDRLFATNHKAGRDYEILETYEVGVELKGTEIKSIRLHHVTIDDSFARIDGGQAMLYNMHIGAYAQGGLYNVDPVRPRRLLLHKRQLERIAGMMSRQRLTLVPLRLYEQHGFAKIELAVGKGKRVFEKRDRIREREIDRDLARRVRHDRSSD